MSTPPSGRKADEDLSAVARRIPKAKRGKNVEESQQMELQRRNLVWMVDFLCKNEHYAGKIREMIENGLVKLGD